MSIDLCKNPDLSTEVLCKNGDLSTSGADNDYSLNLHWHALNYRTAASQHAQAAFEELEACVDRLTSRAVRIADEQMFVCFESYGERDGDGCRRCPAGHGREEFHEAAEWLHQRGYVIPLPGGETFQVIREP